MLREQSEQPPLFRVGRRLGRLLAPSDFFEEQRRPSLSCSSGACRRCEDEPHCRAVRCAHDDGEKVVLRGDRDAADLGDGGADRHARLVADAAGCQVLHLERITQDDAKTLRALVHVDDHGVGRGLRRRHRPGRGPAAAAGPELLQLLSDELAPSE